MVNIKLIARIIGLTLIFEGLFIASAACISFFYNEADFTPILISSVVPFSIGLILRILVKKSEKDPGKRDGYILVSGAWIILTIFGTLPFIFTGAIPKFTNAFFETMSGLTTTGATILQDIESLSRGILFWRSLIQWMGGIGIIILSLSIPPIMKTININKPLFTSDFVGQTSDKIHPRIKETAKRLLAVYLILTLLEFFFLIAGGMTWFDSVCHSMTTISTGGFSTKNANIAAFDSPYIRTVITIFMLMAGTNLTLFYFGLHARFKKIYNNNEFVFYLIICVLAVGVASLLLHLKSGLTPAQAFRDASFNIVSIITTTGYYTANYNSWGSFLILLIFLLMFTGGCAGSTGGSIKMIRLLLTVKNCRLELRRLLHPNAFIPVRINHKVVSQNIVYGVIIFIVLYLMIVIAGTFIISLMGYDIPTSFSTAAASLGNIGPGIGTFGPFSNYSGMTGFGKWFISALMLIGRLEIFTVLILFTKGFYKK
jgi:trk system potassium uptake protein TrkH